MLAMSFLTGPTLAQDLTATLPEDVTRPWIGPAFFANRLQDWQLNDGRIECIEDAKRFPMRTLFHLPTTISNLH